MQSYDACELECKEAAQERRRETELQEAARQARTLFERAERDQQAAMPNLVCPRNLGNPIRPAASIRPITASPPEPPRQNRQITNRQGRGRQGIPRQRLIGKRARNVSAMLFHRSSRSRLCPDRRHSRVEPPASERSDGLSRSGEHVHWSLQTTSEEPLVLDDCARDDMAGSSSSGSLLYRRTNGRM